MTALDLVLTGAEVLLPKEGLSRCDLSIAEGVIQQDRTGRRVDLSGYLVLPGIVDLHGDGFERHIAPRRGAMKQMNEGILAAEAELAANGITTAVLAQFYSWEGGVRGPEFAAQVFRAIAAVKDSAVTDLIPQLRFETNMLGDDEGLAGAHSHGHAVDGLDVIDGAAEQAALNGEPDFEIFRLHDDPRRGILFWRIALGFGLKQVTGI